MHETTQYNESGQVGPGEVCAIHTSSKDGDVYKVLYAGTNIYHPVEHRRLRAHENKKFRSVSKEVFEGYLSFLVGREERKYRQISRIFNG